MFDVLPDGTMVPEESIVEIRSEGELSAPEDTTGSEEESGHGTETDEIDSAGGICVGEVKSVSHCCPFLSISFTIRFAFQRF